MFFLRSTNMKSLESQSSLGTLDHLASPSLKGHLQIARVDHWFKNVFVLPGIIVALSFDSSQAIPDLIFRILLGLLSICLVASSNYVINEVIDAPSDYHHPTKCKRPVPSGQVSVPLAYVQWITLMIAGVILGLRISTPFALTMLVFWIMGCVYNIPPLRSKDLPYIDVLSEAINNPIRMIAGWFIVTTALVPPASLLVSYWMIGCYFMAIKRFAEYRTIGDSNRAAAYRKSFAFFNEPLMLVSIMFYATAAMLFLGAFIMRYRMELILAFPLVALIMATYFALAFKQDSPVQHPEILYRNVPLMAGVMTCTIMMIVLQFVDIPFLDYLFTPTVNK